VAILLLYAPGNLEIWHLYVAGAFTGDLRAFQFPAFSAAMSVMVPKAQYGRANGLVSLADSATTIVAPVLAGHPGGLIGIGGVMAIDVVTFVLAMTAVLLVKCRSPRAQPRARRAVRQRCGKIRSTASATSGSARACWCAAHLHDQQLLRMRSAMILIAPMILARTGNNELILGTVQSALGVGGLVGGLVMASGAAPNGAFTACWPALFSLASLATL
jgi:DHA3 family macrolide efflux protein-like MFS transporter